MNDKEKVIAEIDKTSDKIHKLWNDLSVYDIESLKDAWNDTTCDEFIKKIKNTDKTISDILSQLDLLKTYWQNKIN